MNNKGLRWLLPLLLVLAICLVPLAACDEMPGGDDVAPAPGGVALGDTMVPNVPLDVYVYLQQEKPTVVPAGMLDMPVDMEIDSLSLWGVASGGELAFGAAFRFGSTSQAEQADAQAGAEPDVWTLRVDSTLYVVSGSGPAVETLKTAINNNDFVKYSDEDGLAAAADLSPVDSGEKLVGIAIVKPTDEFIAAITEGEMDEESMAMVDTVLSVTQLKVVAGGIYAKDYLDVARIAAMMDDGGDVLDAGVSIMGMVRSGLPGLIVGPAVGKLLEEQSLGDGQSFTKIEVDGQECYEMAQQTDTGKTVYLVVRTDGSKIFMAASVDKERARSLVIDAGS